MAIAVEYVHTHGSDTACVRVTAETHASVFGSSCGRQANAVLTNIDSVSSISSGRSSSSGDKHSFIK